MIALIPFVDALYRRLHVGSEVLAPGPQFDDLAERLHVGIMDENSIAFKWRLYPSPPDEKSTKIRGMARPRKESVPGGMHPRLTGMRCEAIRIGRGIDDQKKFARLANIDASQYSKIAQGKAGLSTPVVYRLSETYEVPADFIIRGSLRGVDEPIRDALLALQSMPRG